MTAPTPLDVSNARYRAQVAAEQVAIHDEARQIAREALGRGYRPWMRITLLPRDYHTGPREPVAVAYKVYCGDRKRSEFSMFVRRMPDGGVKAAKTYEQLFPELAEKDTTPITVMGREVFPDLFVVCWSAVELYEPQTAEQLAVARGKREARQVEREAAGNLFSEQVREEGPVSKGRGK